MLDRVGRFGNPGLRSCVRAPRPPWSRAMSGPETLANLIARGVALRDAGDLAGAIRLLEAAAAAAPADPEARHLLGGVYGMAGDHAAAVRRFREALALAPSSAATARALGSLLLAGGRYAEGFALME